MMAVVSGSRAVFDEGTRTPSLMVLKVIVIHVDTVLTSSFYSYMSLEILESLAVGCTIGQRPEKCTRQPRQQLSRAASPPFAVISVVLHLYLAFGSATFAFGYRAGHIAAN